VSEEEFTTEDIEFGEERLRQYLGLLVTWAMGPTCTVCAIIRALRIAGCPTKWTTLSISITSV
jgi:hypothetical protein